MHNFMQTDDKVGSHDISLFPCGCVRLTCLKRKRNACAGMYLVEKSYSSAGLVSPKSYSS